MRSINQKLKKSTKLSKLRKLKAKLNREWIEVFQSISLISNEELFELKQLYKNKLTEQQLSSFLLSKYKKVREIATLKVKILESE